MKTEEDQKTEEEKKTESTEAKSKELHLTNKGKFEPDFEKIDLSKAQDFRELSGHRVH
jgi:hypothetical protein